MLRRVLAAIKKAFTPSWEEADRGDPAAFALNVSAMQNPRLGAILGAAAHEVESKHDDDEPQRAP